jgi:8-oxo-dGTP pyrophosphatase MutT (NUDIX family)
VDEAIWKPRATVAALCERDGKYLLVREEADGRRVYNQPAGHLEPHETLLQAVIRETLEETRYEFAPTALLGIYRYQPSPGNPDTYLRFLFRGEVGAIIDGPLDDEIVAVEWLAYQQLLDCRDQHRSPMVMQAIDDSRNRKGFPLDVISTEFA